MIGLFSLFLALLTTPFKSKIRLEAENAALRHQLIVLRRKVQGRVRLTNNDRWFFIQLYRWFPSILQVLTIIRPETLVRWHRVGFRCYWRWKSRPQGGRPQIDMELRVLIRRMRFTNMRSCARTLSRIVQSIVTFARTVATNYPRLEWAFLMTSSAVGGFGGCQYSPEI